MSAFQRMVTKLQGRGGVRNPRALAAHIGRQKYGQAEMTRRSRAARRKQRRRMKRK